MNKNFKIVKTKKPVWVIGDVHGEYKKLIKLLNKIPENDIICFVGDLMDRGRDSQKVIKLIKKRNYFSVKGNHEAIMIDSIKDNDINAISMWLRAGGIETIKSYLPNLKEDKISKFFRDPEFIKILSKKTNVKKDLKWLNNLPLVIKFQIKNNKPLYVSHSGLKLYKSDKDIIKNNTPYEILFERFKKKEVGFAVNIHGHTIRGIKQIKISKSQYDIDTGAYLKRSKFDKAGYLTAIQYPSMKMIHIK